MEISLVTSKQFKIKTRTGTVTLADQSVIKKTDGGEFVVTGPGEYEIGGISFVGTPVAQVVEAEGLRVCRLLPSKERLTEKQLEELGPIDITLVSSWADVSVTVEIARQTDPWVMIVDSFDPTQVLKELGLSQFNPVPKYSITRDKLPSELQVVFLNEK